jgi:hypothetical protein
MQLRWFHIRGVCVAPGCVYRSSSARRDVVIPGDRIKRVETYQYDLASTRGVKMELSVLPEHELDLEQDIRQGG